MAGGDTVRANALLRARGARAAVGRDADLHRPLLPHHDRKGNLLSGFKTAFWSLGCLKCTPSEISCHHETCVSDWHKQGPYLFNLHSM